MRCLGLATRCAEIQPAADGTRSVTTVYSRGTECRTSCVRACGLVMICSSLGKNACAALSPPNSRSMRTSFGLGEAAAHPVGLHALLGPEPLVLVEVRLPGAEVPDDVLDVDGGHVSSSDRQNIRLRR